MLWLIAAALQRTRPGKASAVAAGSASKKRHRIIVKHNWPVRMTPNGFKVIFDLGQGSNPGNDVGLNIPNSNARAALLSLSDDPRATRLDLIEWKQPRAEGKPYPHLYHTGIARVALFTKNLDEEYQRLKAAGVDLVSDPVVVDSATKVERNSSASKIRTEQFWN
ncbi:MAG: hypothetical protein WCA59_02785 [Candidatus Binataceae bacterium]